MVTAVMKLKDACSLEGKLWQTYTAYLKADITLPTKVHIVKAMVFPVVMYRCETSTLTQKSLSRVRLFVTPCTVAYQTSSSMEFYTQQYWSGSHFLLQGIFPTRDQTWVSHIAGRLFMVLATREAHINISRLVVSDSLQPYRLAHHASLSKYYSR